MSAESRAINSTNFFDLFEQEPAPFDLYYCTILPLVLFSWPCFFLFQSDLPAHFAPSSLIWWVRILFCGIAALVGIFACYKLGADLLIIIGNISWGIIYFSLIVFIGFLYWRAFSGNPLFVIKEDEKIAANVWAICLTGYYPFFVKNALNRLRKHIGIAWIVYKTGIDRQAHLLFAASMAALGWALWLQNSGHWQQMAVLDSPVTIPGFFTIPFTASVSFPFALLGWVENPIQSAVSTVAHAPFNVTIALFVGAALLFFFAINRLQYSAVGVRPALAWLAFALFCAAGYLDVGLHWRGAPALPPELIVFNRAFAVLALGVYLFWRGKAMQAFEQVDGESGEYQAAFKLADGTARKIALWLLGLLWVAVQVSHWFGGGFPEWIVTVLLALLVWFPVQDLINFKSQFQAALGRYNKLLALHRASYKPPSTLATDEQVRDALNGGRGIGDRGPDGKPWDDSGD